MLRPQPRLATLALAVAAAAALATGCTARHWPTVPAHAEVSFAAHQRPVRSIDILPIDLQVWAKDRPASPDALAYTVGAHTGGAVGAELASRGYALNVIDDAGEFMAPDGTLQPAMEPDALIETIEALSGYGSALTEAHMNAEEVAPYLPAPLGVATAADATLYVGGWSYVGSAHQSTGAKIAKGLLIGVAIALVIVVVIAAAKSSRGGGGGGVARAAGAVARGAGHAASAVGRSALRVAGHLGRAVTRVGGGVLRTAGRVTTDIARGVLRGPDIFGRTNTHLDLHLGVRQPDYTAYEPPSYHEQPATPKSGASQLYLEMTLVDNRTGELLWHARQVFPANGAASPDVNEAVRRMLATMPPAS